MMEDSTQINFELETVTITELHPHPRNYRVHPEDQIEHIITSIREHGFYRNIVIARDNTILAGHGVVEAARKMGLEEIPVVRLNIDSNGPRALKVLTGDNEIEHLAETDDRVLSELLKEIKDVDLSGLIGTGYDEQMLANLVFVTRPASEILDFDAAAKWVGMPEYDAGEDPLKAIVSFRSQDDRDRFIQKLGITVVYKKLKTWSFWWPGKQREDLSSLRFEG